MKHVTSICYATLFSACIAIPAVAQDTTTEAPATDEVAAATPEAEPMGTPPEGTILLQDKDSILAADMMGARVFNDDAETIGKINDIIIGLDGTVEGVVIGVGGFLGIGEKPVAIELDKISVGQTSTGGPQLILAASRQDLEAANQFVTVQEQRAAEEAIRIQDELQESAADTTQ